MNAKRITIALLADHFLGDYQTIIREAAEITAKEHGANFISIIGRSLESPKPYERIQNAILHEISPDSISGVVLMGAGLAVFSGTGPLEALCREIGPLPMCSVGLELPGIPSVVVDNRVISHAVTHLAEVHGCRKFAYLGGPPANEEAQIRRQAFFETLNALGIPFDTDLEVSGEFSIASGTIATANLIERGKLFDALVAANDTMVLGALSVFKSRGIHVPGNVKVTGFDDTPSARFHFPTVSSIRQPLESLGRYAVESVLRQISGEKTVPVREFAPIFIPRQSCGCLHGKRQIVQNGGFATDGAVTPDFLRANTDAFAQLLISNCQIPRQAFSFWAVRLAEALADEVEGAKGSFISTLEDIVKSSDYRLWLIDDLQHVITVLRKQFLELKPAATVDLDSLWHDARLFLSDAAAFSQAKEQTAADLLSAFFLRRAGAEPAAELTEEAFVSTVTAELTTVGFANGWVSVCTAPDSCDLECVAAVQNGESIIADRHRYPAGAVIPPQMKLDKQVSYVLLPLSSGTDRLGVIGLEAGAPSLYYEILREHVSSYLKSVNIFKHRVESLLAQADMQRKELEMQHLQKLESLGVLAGGIAHDFNNMLSAMATNLDAAILDTADHAHSEPLTECKSVVMHASGLCRQLLAYSGKGQFLVKRVDLNQLLEDLLGLLRVSTAKRAHLTFELDKRLPDMEGDTAQLNQIFLNLVINAAEAMVSGNGKIVVRTCTKHLNASYFSNAAVGNELSDGAYISAEISDTGSGIPKEIQNKIFDPFFTTKFAGRGLGLAAVLGIVRGHRGALKLNSTQGVGTTFEILFPILKRLSISPKRATQSPTFGGSGTVLIVDDEPTVLRAAERLLRRMGFAVLTATGGQEGIDILSQDETAVSVVILDMTMPGMGGIETMTIMRQIHPKMPIVLTSGYTEQHAVISSAAETPSAFLEKPYDMERLNVVLGKVLGRNQDA